MSTNFANDRDSLVVALQEAKEILKTVASKSGRLAATPAEHAFNIIDDNSEMAEGWLKKWKDI